MSRLLAPWQGVADAFTVDSLAAVPFLFEGHRTILVTGHWAPRPATTADGWFYVSTDQRLGTFAACLLEPASEDGYATWNLLDRDLRRGEEAPLLPVRVPLPVPMTLVE